MYCRNYKQSSVPSLKAYERHAGDSPSSLSMLKGVQRGWLSRRVRSSGLICDRRRVSTKSRNLKSHRVHVIDKIIDLILGETTMGSSGDVAMARKLFLDLPGQTLGPLAAWRLNRANPRNRVILSASSTSVYLSYRPIFDRSFKSDAR